MNFEKVWFCLLQMLNLYTSFGKQAKMKFCRVGSWKKFNYFSWLVLTLIFFKISKLNWDSFLLQRPLTTTITTLMLVFKEKIIIWEVHKKQPTDLVRSIKSITKDQIIMYYTWSLFFRLEAIIIYKHFYNYYTIDNYPIINTDLQLIRLSIFDI